VLKVSKISHTTMINITEISFQHMQECSHGDIADGAWGLVFPDSLRPEYKNEYVKVLRSWSTQTPEVGIMKPEAHTQMLNLLANVPITDADSQRTAEQDNMLGDIQDLKSDCPAIYFLLHSGAATWNNALLKLLRQMLQLSSPEWVQMEDCEPRSCADYTQNAKRSKKAASHPLQQENRNISISKPCPQMSLLHESGNQRSLSDKRNPTDFEIFSWVRTSKTSQLFLCAFTVCPVK